MTTKQFISTYVLLKNLQEQLILRVKIDEDYITKNVGLRFKERLIRQNEFRLAFYKTCSQHIIEKAEISRRNIISADDDTQELVKLFNDLRRTNLCTREVQAKQEILKSDYIRF